MSKIKTATCSSCGKTIQPTESAIQFTCPSCGKVTIWRCAACRKRGNTYRCINCGFEGP